MPDPAIPVLQGAVADALAACRWLRRLGVPDEQAPSMPRPRTGSGRSSTPSGRAARRRPRRTSTAPSVWLAYNHESPRRPQHFLPRKVTRAAAAISLGLQDEWSLVI